MGIKCEETQDHFKSFYVISRKSVLALVLLSQMFPEVCTVSSFRANNSSEHFALIPLWYFRHSSLSNNPPTNLLVCYIINSPLFFFFFFKWRVGKQRDKWVCLILKLHPKTLSQFEPSSLSYYRLLRLWKWSFGVCFV